MPVCVTIERVTTRRDGVRTIVPPNTAFAFTDEEVDALRGLNPPVIRAPVVEAPAPVLAPMPAEPAAPAPAAGGRRQSTKEADL